MRRLGTLAAAITLLTAAPASAARPSRSTRTRSAPAHAPSHRAAIRAGALQLPASNGPTTADSSSCRRTPTSSGSERTGDSRVINTRRGRTNNGDPRSAAHERRRRPPGGSSTSGGRRRRSSRLTMAGRRRGDRLTVATSATSAAPYCSTTSGSPMALAGNGGGHRQRERLDDDPDEPGRGQPQRRIRGRLGRDPQRLATRRAQCSSCGTRRSLGNTAYGAGRRNLVAGGRVSPARDGSSA